MFEELSRRELLERAGWLAAGSSIVSAASALAQNTAGSQDSPPAGPPSERIRLGFIGVGGMGRGLLGDFLGQAGTEVVAIADVYDPHANEAGKMCNDRGQKPQLYRDFRKVLDRKDVDAVVIATPDHWHAIPSILACQAGKDVYVEKPLCYTLAEGRAMVNAARKHNRVTQMGIQIHATENYRRAVQIVQSGMLGTISKVRVWLASNNLPGIGKPADGTPPADCDYDLWLGPAPQRAFNPLRFTFSWRYFWDYGGGCLGDMACHITDLVYWALKLESPRTIVASGGRYALDDIGETPDTMEVVWDYVPSPERKNPLQLVWSSTQANSRGIEGRGLGIAFYGSNATLVADYDRHEIIAEGERLKGVEKPEPSIPPSVGHRREFLDAIKSRQRCSCDVEYGYKLTTVPLTGNIALRTGLKLTWDADKERFIDAPAANQMLSREYRKPWHLPV